MYLDQHTHFFFKKNINHMLSYSVAQIYSEEVPNPWPLI